MTVRKKEGGVVSTFYADGWFFVVQLRVIHSTCAAFAAPRSDIQLVQENDLNASFGFNVWLVSE